MSWILDTKVESTPLTTTGGHTWPAAQRLGDYLSATAAELGLDKPGVKILELGAGCGWLGITVARNLPRAEMIVLTEQEGGGACDWLQHNVTLNRNSDGITGLLDKVIVQPCDWLKYSDSDSLEEEKQSEDGGTEEETFSPLAKEEEYQNIENIEWDFIIGSDLIYNDIGSTCLPKVMAAMARPHTKILYCHTKHRYDLLDMELFENLEKVGLNCIEMKQPGVITPPPSPPLQFPPIDLFPEKRIAVYLITKQLKDS